MKSQSYSRRRCYYTYGLEAFCVFSHQQQKQQMPKTKIGDEAAAERMRNYARLFADRLLNEFDHFEPDQNQEGDEEDIVSSLYRLAMYSLQRMNSSRRWRTKLDFYARWRK
jgi:hypothetical protein